MLKELDYFASLRKETDSWLEEHGDGIPYAKHVALAPELFHLLCQVSLDPQVSANHRGMLTGAIVYFINPMDMIPEAVHGQSGFIDDVALAAHALDRVASATSAHVLRHHWTGKDDVMEVLTAILADAGKMIGRGRWSHLKELLGTPG